MQDMPVSQQLLASSKHPETRASLPRFHVIFAPHAPRSASKRKPFSRGRQFPNEDAHAFQHCHARQGTIGSSTPLTTTVIFYGRMTARHILPGIIGFGAKELSPTGISLLGRAVGLVSPQRKSLPLWPPKH
jgi:hypothetical protein